MEYMYAATLYILSDSIFKHNPICSSHYYIHIRGGKLRYKEVTKQVIQRRVTGRQVLALGFRAHVLSHHTILSLAKQDTMEPP